MKRKRFTEEQIIGVMKSVGAGAVAELCRQRLPTAAICGQGSPTEDEAAAHAPAFEQAPGIWDEIIVMRNDRIIVD